MLTTISQPIWILIGVIGIADICLVWWCLTLMRRSKKADRRGPVQDDTPAWAEQWVPSNQFQQNLVGLQIDAVFNGLTALIDTERIKLKSLLGQMASPDQNAPQSYRVGHHHANEQQERPETQIETIAQQIVQIADSGEKPAGIANQLGISLAEVELAMKMRAARRPPASRKLEAVA